MERINLKKEEQLDEYIKEKKWKLAFKLVESRQKKGDRSDSLLVNKKFGALWVDPLTSIGTKNNHPPLLPRRVSYRAREERAGGAAAKEAAYHRPSGIKTLRQFPFWQEGPG